MSNAQALMKLMSSLNSESEPEKCERAELTANISREDALQGTLTVLEIHQKGREGCDAGEFDDDLALAFFRLRHEKGPFLACWKLFEEWLKSKGTTDEGVLDNHFKEFDPLSDEPWVVFLAIAYNEMSAAWSH